MDIHWLSPIKKFCVKVITLFFRLWISTLSIEISKKGETLLNRYRGQPKICALWHNRLFIAPALFKRFFNDLPMHGLVSPSKDGAWLAELLSGFDIGAIRGSSKRGGQRALLEMVDAIRCNQSVTITPDGPRGPKYISKPGIATLAKETGAPIILGGIHIASGWRLHSWDQFYIPKPFSRVTIRIEVISPKIYNDLDDNELLSLIQNTLYGLNAKHHFLKSY